MEAYHSKAVIILAPGRLAIRTEEGVVLREKRLTEEKSEKAPGRGRIAPASSPAKSPAPKRRLPSIYLFLAIFGLIVGIGGGSAWYYRNFKQNYRVAVERQLSVIAELKVDELVRYRQERLADAAVFYKNAAFSALVSRHFERPENREAGDQLRSWLGQIQASHKYDRVMLLDTLYSRKMIIPDGPERSAPFVSPSSSEGLRSGKIVFEDFYWNEQNRRIYLKVLVPILDESHGGRVIGILALRIDPETYLYPLICRWPTPSRTAETLLIRRDGNDALFLNELKFQKNTALRLRIPLEKKNVPAVKAALGQEGIVEGKDYRGVAVIAALHSVPDSPWFMVARMDTSEVFGPMKERLRDLIVIAALLVFGMGATLVFIWRKQRARFDRDRYKATGVLRESESLLSAITDSAQDVILMMDPKGCVTFWNAAAERVLGYPRAEAFGRNLHDLIAPERYLEAHNSAFPEFLRTGQGAAIGQTLELYARRKDGREIAVALSLSSVLIKGEWHAVGIVRDINERKRIEEELRIKERAIESALSAIAISDLAGNVNYVNPAFLKLWGYSSPAEVLGKSVTSFSTIGDKTADIIETLRARGSWRGELVALRKDGARFNVDLGASMILDASSSPICMMASFEDITERKRTEEELRKSEDRFKLIFEFAPDAYYLNDLKGNFIDGNIAAEKTTGYKKAELIGSSFLKLHLLSLNQLPKAAKLLAYNIMGKSTGPDEFILRRKTGDKVSVEISTHPVKFENKTIVLGIARDITERKLAEEALHVAMEKLEQANARLEVSIKRADQMAFEAQAANIAKSQFLANMSHEIRTPMNGVLGMAGLLLGTELSKEQRQYAETVNSSAEALMSVINDILDFSKIEADKVELEELNFDLRTMMEDTAEMLAMRAQEKGLEFICRIAPEVNVLLRGDPGRLRQVLVNLGGNAIKFTSRGEVVIEVKLESESEDRLQARFEVRDTGIGIPRDKIELLFKVFQQLDASTTRRFGGTGLGLAISKRLVELMGGRIGVDSVEGRGSTFWFTVTFGKQPPGRQAAETPRADIRGVRVLAVDENATNRLVLAEQLAALGVRHAEAESGAKAIDMLRAARAQGDPFRIVLLDMQMPGMDGESLGKTLKADSELRDIPLVMMTSSGKRGDTKRLEAIGFSAYLTKPVKQSQLFDCLATVLGAGDPSVKTSKTGLVTRFTINEARQRKVRILVADDNIINQRVAVGVLEKRGFSAEAVADGQEAIHALEMIPYDIVFMDVQMPVMDGYEATRAIRSGKTKVLNQRIPIIAMTAHSMKGDRELCLEAGMDDYISKPITPQALAEAVKKWLDPVQAPSPEAPASKPKTISLQGQAVFDRPALLARLMGDRDLVKEIIAIFLRDMPQKIQTLKTRIEQGDAGLAGEQAHAIKSAADNVGGLVLSAVIYKMEKSCRAGRLQEAAALLPELERQFNLLQARLREAEG